MREMINKNTKLTELPLFELLKTIRMLKTSGYGWNLQIN